MLHNCLQQHGNLHKPSVDAEHWRFSPGVELARYTYFPEAENTFTSPQSLLNSPAGRSEIVSPICVEKLSHSGCVFYFCYSKRTQQICFVAFTEAPFTTILDSVVTVMAHSVEWKTWICCPPLTANRVVVCLPKTTISILTGQPPSADCQRDSQTCTLLSIFMKIKNI